MKWALARLISDRGGRGFVSWEVYSDFKTAERGTSFSLAFSRGGRKRRNILLNTLFSCSNRLPSQILHRPPHLSTCRQQRSSPVRLLSFRPLAFFSRPCRPSCRQFAPLIPPPLFLLPVSSFRVEYIADIRSSLALPSSHSSPASLLTAGRTA
jgi:hypothetical protein